jgi:hypothetical protein
VNPAVSEAATRTPNRPLLKVESFNSKTWWPLINPVSLLSLALTPSRLTPPGPLLIYWLEVHFLMTVYSSTSLSQVLSR